VGIPNGCSAQKPVRENEDQSLEGFGLRDRYENSYGRAAHSSLVLHLSNLGRRNIHYC